MSKWLDFRINLQATFEQWKGHLLIMKKFKY